MNILKKGNILIVYQRQGNDKNGNPIFIINFFDESMHNINYKIDVKKDKYNNIKIQSYNINIDTEYLINKIKE